ncbi:unnamed protein product [Parascedosporium putredinis]|uniref:SPIN90/Ldb17 leucine-rich domain-containing protein n=1 Tax=Parascedosporium putredinis TaxID=1442378 RepID=A0A9P1M8X2_9PEZI|nr:unnamed protein product [Parascedosporium putredinis]CAI7994630.1 unnamed protein product [Parascedosporium putredinis]
MADLDTSADQETDVQFWQDLSKVLSGPCDTHEQIDDALRGWLDLASAFRDRFGDLDSGVLHCAHQLIHRPIFQDNKDYVRVQIIFSFLQEDEPNPLHTIANFLLADGRSDDTVFGRMISEGCFPRLLDFLNSNLLMDPPLYHTLLELMYEMCRMERLRTTDLLQIDDSFIARLLQLVKEGSGDSDDPYQYSVIRVLLVLNEQYMLAATEAEAAGPLSPSSSLTNRVIKLLSLHGSSFRAFGENIILLLNRETETSQQLLILKVLYLLFTTKATYESFYTNDLKVLVDIILRNLMDLPDEKISLRHTYLRVLYPL